MKQTFYQYQSQVAQLKVQLQKADSENLILLDKQNSMERYTHELEEMV